MTEDQQPSPPIKPRKLRKIAKEVLRVSQKAFFHKQDLLAPEDQKEWEIAMEELHALIRDKKAEPADLCSQAEKVDKLVSRHGELFYHKKSRVENMEMFLVAAIVVLGVRSFFLQPFIIPTNSMYPTFNGMQIHLYEEGDELPNPVERTARKLLFGSAHYRVVAESDGTNAKISGPERIRASFPNGRFFILPTDLDKYTVTIDDLEEHTLLLPPEVKPPHPRLGPFSRGDPVLAFDVELGDALFVDRFTYNFFSPKVGDPIVFKTENIAAYNRDVLKQRVYQPLLDYQRGYWEERPDIQIQFPSDIYNADQINAKDGTALFTKTDSEWTLTDQGKKRLRKDVIDNLPSEQEIYVANFDSRVIQLYSGKREKVYFLYPHGDEKKPTDGVYLTPSEGDTVPDVPLIVFDERGTCYKVKSQNEEKYYIKRLVGISGDVLRVEERNLQRNDNQIAGSIAFEGNRNRSEGYHGYGAENLLGSDKSLRVPENCFFAMGDNSDHSLDGRTWGFVPEQKVVGRALFIYYPFTKHWGLAE